MQMLIYYPIYRHWAGKLHLHMFYDIHQGRGMLEYIFEDSSYEKG